MKRSVAPVDDPGEDGTGESHVDAARSDSRPFVNPAFSGSRGGWSTDVKSRDASRTSDTGDHPLLDTPTAAAAPHGRCTARYRAAQRAWAAVNMAGRDRSH